MSTTPKEIGERLDSMKPPSSPDYGALVQRLRGYAGKRQNPVHKALRDAAVAIERLAQERDETVRLREAEYATSVHNLQHALDGAALLATERDEARRAFAACADDRRKLIAELARLKGIVLPHARKQENANGFQRGWHAALNRIVEGDEASSLSALVPEPAAVVEVPVCEAEAESARLAQENERLRDRIALLLADPPKQKEARHDPD